MKDINFLKNSVIAHRGFHDNVKIPENSLKAFEKAVKNNYVIELDIQLTKDNEIVVSHDKELDRLTNNKGKTSDYTLSELKKMKLLNTNSTIPTLKEVLNLVNGKVPVLVELKSDYRLNKLEKRFLEVIKDYNGNFAVQSFNPLSILFIKKHNKDYIRGLLITDKQDILQKTFSKLPFLKILKPDFLSVNKKLCDNKKLLDLKKDIPILAWNINSKEELEKYSDLFTNLIANVNKIK